MEKASSSQQRVENAAKTLGLGIKILEMPQSTRTAQEAADACGCDVGQIVKSMIFMREDNQELVLILVSGAHNADMKLLAEHFGCKLKRADIERVRAETGFAIGGVAPIGHLSPLMTVMDEALMQYASVWAAAGKPNSVFETDPNKLVEAVSAKTLVLA